MAHTCHAFECTKTVDPEMFMCLAHWRRVPRELKKLIWALYRPGQCDDKNISKEYALTAKAAIQAVAAKEGKVVPLDHECLRLYDYCVGDSTQPSIAAQVQAAKSREQLWKENTILPARLTTINISKIPIPE